MARKPKGQKQAGKAPKKSQRAADHNLQLAKEMFADFVGSELGSMEFRLPGEGPLSPGESRRMMETLMRGLTGRMGMTSSDATQDRAMDLCDRAMDAPPSKAKKLAQQALQVWPDCAQAYVILAELADSVSEVLPLYEQGVAAGRRALTDEWDWLQDEEAFWGYLPTRPFLHALAGLADALWGIGRRDEAAERYLELLTLNPNDNQGIRNVAVPRLMEMGRNDDARRILKQYAGYDDCFTAYNLALLEFRKHGDCAKTKKLLKKALQANEHVPTYLVSNRMLPSRRPDSYSWESPEEAQIYVDLAQRAWKTTPGAIAWLRGAWSPTEDSPAAIETDVLLQLPQCDETWLLVIAPVTSPEDGSQGATMMLTDLASEAVVGSEVFEVSPTPADIWNAVAQTTASPKAGAARRPRRIELIDEDLCAELRSDFEQIGITAELSADEELRERFQRGLARMANRAAFTGELSDLPIAEDEEWIVACRQLDSWIRDDDGQLQRPWAMLVLAPQAILASNVTTQTPSAEDWRQALCMAMTNPLLDEPHRPAQILVRSADHRLMLEPLLDGIPCIVSDEHAAAVDALFDDLSQTLDGRGPLTPYVQQEGMTVERVGHFFESAAEYFRRAPWTFTPSDAVWEIQPAGFEHPWYAIVIGQNGETYGLSLIEHFDDCRRMMSGELLDGGVLSVSSMCLNFDEAHTLTGPDLDAADQFGWPIAAPEAYPLVYRTGLNAALQTPSASDFDLLEATLQTLPDFIRSRQDCGTATARLNGQSLEVRLARVPPSQLKPKRRR